MNASEVNCMDFFNKDESVFEVECKLIISSLLSCEFYKIEKNRFFLGVRPLSEKTDIFAYKAEKYRNALVSNRAIKGALARAYTGDYDFGHTSAGWSNVISLGIWGLRNRIGEYKEKYATKENAHFYVSLQAVYDAALSFMCRASAFAKEAGLGEMSESLLNLTKRPPATLYEAMQTSILYYFLQQYFDNTPLRTMGRVDSLFYCYFKKEDKTRGRILVADYLNALDSIKAIANLPFAIGGTDMDGKSLANELSLAFLDAYRSLQTKNVKLHFLFSEDMPKALVRNAFECIREGRNGIVFLSDKKVIESLENIGADRCDAVDYHVVGCYECGANGELTCSCNARVNLLKALEYALSDGVDVLTGDRIGLSVSSDLSCFDALMLEYERQLAYLVKCAKDATDVLEMEYKHLHSSPILSATYTSALEKGGDLYCDRAAKYNNSSMNALGLASAADSLYAIKKIVYDDKKLKLSELCDILRFDWNGCEPLRLWCKNKLPKFGSDHGEVDAIAARIVEVLAKEVNGTPNKKGGKYRLGLFSIDWRWDFGKATATSADGRRAGEPLSQNTSASFGAEREGIGAHLSSVAKLDSKNTPNGTIVDIDVHSSSVRGENGLNLLVSSMQTYFQLGGFAVHYNVLDTDVLLDAKKYPEKYPSLQVRLCGWNVLFSSLSEKEKEEFIMRSMHE